MDKKNEIENTVPDEDLDKVAGGQREMFDPAYSGATCPRGVTAETFPCSPHCFNIPHHKCDFYVTSFRRGKITDRCQQFDFSVEK